MSVLLQALAEENSGTYLFFFEIFIKYLLSLPFLFKIIFETGEPIPIILSLLDECIPEEKVFP